MKLDGKVAVVTGGAMGNGLGIVKVFLKYGAKVIILDYSDELVNTITELKKEGYDALGYKVDISDNRQVEGAVRDIETKFDKVDILVNNAGICMLEKFEDMKVRNPRRYKVAGLGDWGIVDGLVYENWEEKAFDIDIVRSLQSVISGFGLDFGYTNDPSALFCGLIDEPAKTIWVFDEMYKNGMSNEAIALEITDMGYAKEKIRADSAEPKSIARLKELGLPHICKARKGKDSVNNGIDYLQDFHMIIHPRCVNFQTEISNYTWMTDPKTGKKINIPIDDFNHLMDAMRYGFEDMQRKARVSFLE